MDNASAHNLSFINVCFYWWIISVMFYYITWGLLEEWCSLYQKSYPIAIILLYM